MIHKSFLILSDIEGSSGCTGYESGRYLGKGWPEACLGMTRDVDAVASALIRAGADRVIVKDFHRTAYNLLPEHLDSRARLISGYRREPIPGIGSHHDATALIMLGMHAPSGADGFLAHTLTTRISRLEVNGSLMTEAQLFSSSLAPFGVIPVFFSGCPVACRYAETAIPGLKSHPLDTSVRFDPDAAISWRKALADAVIHSVTSPGRSAPYCPDGPFRTVITLRDGEHAASKIANRWGLEQCGADIRLTAPTMHDLYNHLIRISYLTPLTEAILPIGLHLYSAMGYLGRVWVRRKLNGQTPTTSTA